MERRSFGGARLLIGLAMAAFALISYMNKSQVNPVTGEKQHISISQDQEIALGLQSAPEMMAQFGGPSQDAEATALVQKVGEKIVASSEAGKSGYEYHFVLLGDQNTINAFALPGGPVFITEALLARLKTEGQLAGVLGHEISHVVLRHSAEQIAQQELTQGLTGALILSTYDPNNRNSGQSAQMALLIANLINLRYSRNDELESDRFGVKYMGEAGYDPNAMLGVMEVLSATRQGGEPPEFFSTHPSPENRSDRIADAIREFFPDGPPAGAIP